MFRAIRPTAGAASFVQAVGVANWVLEGIASREYRLCKWAISGEEETNHAIRVRVARDSVAGTGARTALANSSDVVTPNTQSAFISTTYASTQPTIATGELDGGSISANGGFYDWEDPTEVGFQLIGATSMEQRADVGAYAVLCKMKWKEL